MADSFDVNQYKSENSRLSLTQKQKSLIIAKMYQTEDAMKKENTNSKKYCWIKGVAAVLVVALIAGVGFISFSNNNKSENWFMLSVAAASTSDESSLESTGDEQNSTQTFIDGYTESAMSGFFMEGDYGTLAKDGFKDYFAYYHMEDLVVKGENIKSITFESNKKGVYFVLTPTDNSADYLSNNAYIDSALTEFDERASLDNSQYSLNELRQYAPWIMWPCDGFRYNNEDISTGEEDNLLPTNHIDIMLESDHSNAEIAKLVKEIGAIGNINEESSYERYAELEEKIQQKMLENAKLTVTVTYADDSTETQIINLIYKGNRSLAFDI